MIFCEIVLNWILNWIIFWRNSNIELNQFGYRSPLVGKRFAIAVRWTIFFIITLSSNMLSIDLNSIIRKFNRHYFISKISSLFQVHYKDGCHYKGTEKVDDNNWSAHFPFFRSVPVPNPNATTPQRWEISHFSLSSSSCLCYCRMFTRSHIIYHWSSINKNCGKKRGWLLLC